MSKVIERLLKRFGEIKKNRSGDAMYDYFDDSQSKILSPRTVPLLVQNPFSRVGKEPYSVLGLKKYYPWFISNNNTGSNQGFIEVVTDILQKLEASENRDTHVIFLRGDVNIFMPWLRVSAPFFFFPEMQRHLVVHRWFGQNHRSSIAIFVKYVHLWICSTSTRR